MPKMQAPAATKYHVKNSLNENFNSVHSYAGHTKIGKNSRSFIDENWYLKQSERQPGPGAYHTFSDFSGAV